MNVLGMFYFDNLTIRYAAQWHSASSEITQPILQDPDLLGCLKSGVFVIARIDHLQPLQRDVSRGFVIRR